MGIFHWIKWEANSCSSDEWDTKIVSKYELYDVLVDDVHFFCFVFFLLTNSLLVCFSNSFQLKIYISGAGAWSKTLPKSKGKDDCLFYGKYKYKYPAMLSAHIHTPYNASFVWHDAWSENISRFQWLNSSGVLPSHMFPHVSRRLQYMWLCSPMVRMWDVCEEGVFGWQLCSEVWPPDGGVYETGPGGYQVIQTPSNTHKHCYTVTLTLSLSPICLLTCPVTHFLLECLSLSCVSTS